MESIYLLLLLLSSFASRAFVFHAHAEELAYRGYTLDPEVFSREKVPS